MNEHVILEARNVSKTYNRDGQKISANRDISFCINNGEVAGLLGPNGAGKTTIIKQLVNLVTPDTGDVFYKSINLRENPGIMRGRCSILLEGMRNVYHYLTGRGNLIYFALLNGVPLEKAKDRASDLLKRMGLWQAKDKYAFTYSSGMNRKLAIATCLINEPELIILDEPTSGLDVVAVEDLAELIRGLSREHGRTFLIASHDMRFIERVCSTVLWLKDGRLVMRGGVEEIKKLNKNKSVVVRIPASAEAEAFFKKEGISPEQKSGAVLPVRLFLPKDNSVFSALASRFEILDIEKEDSDFEAIFKEVAK